VQTEPQHILTINGGSSSLKFSVYTNAGSPELKLKGSIERIGQSDSILHFTDDSKQEQRLSVQTSNMEEAGNVLTGWLKKRKDIQPIISIGHRIVHGMEHTKAEPISDALIKELQQISAYDPDHLPAEIGLINTFRDKFPGLIQFACFDTSFHTSLPRVARLLPIPRRFDRKGIRRYGFHGLSYSFLMEELIRSEEPAAANGRIILAHLGNGASLAAVLAGRCIDTSMGFTPTGGCMMGTRPGDLDPGIMTYIMKNESLNEEQFNGLVNHECGLLGVSETSSDMQDLLKNENKDIRAAEAVTLFCYNVKKWIGSFTAVLNGLDVLVFSGGIGEHASPVRSRICQGLEFLGVELDEKKNEKSDRIISSGNSRVLVCVIPTNEELMIAKTVCELLSRK
jgi:acetate kinase